MPGVATLSQSDNFSHSERIVSLPKTVCYSVPLLYKPNTLGGSVKAPNDPKERLKFFYEQILLARRFEEQVGQMYGAGHVTGFCHLYIGQEAVAVGGMAALEQHDYALASYREHPHPILKGTDPKRVRRSRRLSRGRGGESVDMTGALRPPDFTPASDFGQERERRESHAPRNSCASVPPSPPEHTFTRAT